MKKFWFILVIMPQLAFSDVIIGPSVKYGPNGYEASGVSGSSSSTITTKKGLFGKKTTSTTLSSGTNSLNVDDRIEAVLGLKVQTVPSEGGLSLGASYYMDSTIEMNVGIRL